MKANTVCLLGALVVTTGAWSQTPADSDGDGVVSLAELQARNALLTAQRFAALDTDGDGLLTRDEMRASRGRGPRAMRRELARIDTDGDGAWSLAELQVVRPEFNAERFSRMDTDGNGLISADERPFRRGRGGRRAP